MGLLVVKNKGIYIFNNNEEKEELIDILNPSISDYKILNDNKKSLIYAKEWSGVNKIIGFRLNNNVDNFQVLTNLKKENVSFVKIKTAKEKFIFPLNSFYVLNTEKRLVYNNITNKIEIVDFLGSQIYMMENLIKCIKDFAKIQEKTFLEAGVDYFEFFKKSLKYDSFKKYHNECFCKIGNDIMFTITGDELIFKEKSGIVFKNSMYNKQISNDDILNIEEIYPVEIISDPQIIKIIKEVERIRLR